ncbi:hypothetical protein LguiB_027189 [Lonicera macranthoides]
MLSWHKKFDMALLKKIKMTWHLISSSQFIFYLFNFFIPATPLIPTFTTIFSGHSIDPGHLHFFFHLLPS